MQSVRWRTRDITLLLVLVLLPIILSVGATLFLAIPSVFLASLLMPLSAAFLPFYARRQKSKGRFLIRFHNPIVELNLNRRAKARLAMSHAWIPFALCVFVASTAISGQGLSGLETGEGFEFYKCADGEEILYRDIGSAGCEDGSDDLDPNPQKCLYPVCSGDPVDRVSERIFGGALLGSVMLSPMAAFLTAPLVVLRQSSISVVDKQRRSIVPIGRKAEQMLNAVFGFGAVVLLTQSSWRVASATSESLIERIDITFYIMLMTLMLLLALFHVLWIYSYLNLDRHMRHLTSFEQKLISKEVIVLHNFDDTEPRAVRVNSMIHTLSKK